MDMPWQYVQRDVRWARKLLYSGLILGCNCQGRLWKPYQKVVWVVQAMTYNISDIFLRQTRGFGDFLLQINLVSRIILSVT